MPFTDATEVGVEILNSLPFCGLTFAAILPYLISRDLLILFPDRSPIIVKSELSSIFTTVLSSRYMSAMYPFFPVLILSWLLSGDPGFNTCAELKPLYITVTSPFVLIAMATFEEGKRIELIRNILIR